MCIDVSKKALKNRDYQISVQDIEEWEQTNGVIEENCIIQFHTGYGILLGSNIPGYENLANTDLLPAKDFTIEALPMKIGGGSGAPRRIIATTNSD